MARIARPIEGEKNRNEGIDNVNTCEHTSDEHEARFFQISRTSLRTGAGMKGARKNKNKQFRGCKVEDKDKKLRRCETAHRSIRTRRAMFANPPPSLWPLLRKP